MAAAADITHIDHLKVPAEQVDILVMEELGDRMLKQLPDRVVVAEDRAQLVLPQDQLQVQVVAE